jgi:hypothetical protein
MEAQKQQQQPIVEFEPSEPLSAISTPNLTDSESAALLRCINDVRQGEKVFFVRLTNRKQTKSRKRMPGEDYRPDPSLAPHAHEGMLVAAPLNRQKQVYLHLLDEARAPGDEPTGHTRITMRGILSFKVLAEHPGPLAPPPPVAAPASDALVESLLLQAQGVVASVKALQQRQARP